jgi:hypothetical protein
MGRRSYCCAVDSAARSYVKDRVYNLELSGSVHTTPFQLEDKVHQLGTHEDAK